MSFLHSHCIQDRHPHRPHISILTPRTWRTFSPTSRSQGQGWIAETLTGSPASVHASVRGVKNVMATEPSNIPMNPGDSEETAKKATVHARTGHRLDRPNKRTAPGRYPPEPLDLSFLFSHSPAADGIWPPAMQTAVSARTSSPRRHGRGPTPCRCLGPRLREPVEVWCGPTGPGEPPSVRKRPGRRSVVCRGRLHGDPVCSIPGVRAVCWEPAYW